jgi:hypothetical protein
MDCPKTRYCPSCDLKGLAPYTAWVLMEFDGDYYEQCENDTRDEDSDIDSDHNTYMEDGSYMIMCCLINRGNIPGGLKLQCRVEGCVCMKLFSLLWKAIKREADAGIFDPAMWAPTFPHRTVELMEQSRAVATAALANELPAVLICVVVDYLW